MKTYKDLQQLEQKKVCCNCVEEKYLSAQITNDGKNGTCSYCGKKTKCFSLEQFADKIQVAFEQHYDRTSTEPEPWEYAILADKEEHYEWDRKGDNIIYVFQEAAGIDEEIASDVQEVLEVKFDDMEAAQCGIETEFSSDSHYEENKPNEGSWQSEWLYFETSLKTETRFFSKAASQFLSSIFSDLDKMKTADGQSLIIEAGPGRQFSEVYRARSFQSNKKLEEAIKQPGKFLGPPPYESAHAGRMNAQGISVFYSSNNIDTALAEVRPPVGSKVVTARFDIIRKLQLLDLTALNSVTTKGSIFDPEFIEHLERTMFLQNLSQRITMPVMPNHETFEYLATQVIADYLSSENNPPLDGIIFPSVQTNDKALNVVLFHKAAGIEELELIEGTEVTARLGEWDDEDWENNYNVYEEYPPEEKEEPKKDFTFPILPDFLRGSETNLDSRPPTLKIDLDSIFVHIVESVKFNSSKHRVTRHRWEKRKSANDKIDPDILLDIF